jgi:hypothetical protein
MWVPLLLLANVATEATADAAEEVGLGIAYDPRVPLGRFREVVPDPGLGGVQARWDYFPLDELSIGFNIQYNHFRRGEPADAAAGQNDPVTTAKFRNVSCWGFLATARYYLSTSALRPYAELGAGLSNVTGAVLANDLSRRDAGGGFIIQPSIGVLIPFVQEGDSPSPSLSPSLSTDEDDGHEHDLSFTMRRPRESMFGLTVSLTYAFTSADVGEARNVAYAGFQLGIYAKP